MSTNDAFSDAESSAGAPSDTTEYVPGSPGAEYIPSSASAIKRWKFRDQSPHYFESMDYFEREYPYNKVTYRDGFSLLTRLYPTDETVEDIEQNGPGPWTRFAKYVKFLNESSPPEVRYKVLYLTRAARHVSFAQNLEAATGIWMELWSPKFCKGHKSGNCHKDPPLCAIGVQQARALATYWAVTSRVQGLPVPDSLYVSPLLRSLETTNCILDTMEEITCLPMIKEGLRERYTLKPCNMRHSRRRIHDLCPRNLFEPGFADQDPFHGRTKPETVEEVEARKQAVLEEIFEMDSGMFISLMVHEEGIQAILNVCNAEPFEVREGMTVALLVAGRQMSADRDWLDLDFAR